MNSRPMTEADYERVIAMLADDESRLFNRPSSLTVNDLREWVSRTDLEHDTWLYEEDGELRGVGWTDQHGDVSVLIGAVAPDYKGRGLGATLLDRAIARAQEKGGERLHAVALGPDSAAMELIRSRGFEEVRRFYGMAIELKERPAEPDVPVETFRLEEAEAFHAAMDDAFQDHWEHTTTPFEEWWERHRNNPNFDPTCWFLIRDGDEIAAVSRNEGNRNGGGYIGALGVRRAWRGKGYAKALLYRSFAEFWDRGMTRVTLGVDATNPTGATHLYERVGMHVEDEQVVLER
jgi:ribosomal protein S18 acetylase RimI-like enzyme